MDKRELLRELQFRIDAASVKNDWQAVELHTATAIRIMAEPNIETSGLARRIAARKAATPLDLRMAREDETAPALADIERIAADFNPDAGWA